ncbi:CPBP family intramembrane glutamic endopeptidase [Piscinibacter terrae]|uniref:CPBP family intramembrane metalloprotease n=1 Tax=Piscinibacter terrae TaxID=2496871 RepID=A0A3N7J3A1_9BURK|nr:CPBP family intramembrane glutamic endopeptidase [Albitalea terrae]RQP25412.1 CPBP family intramembrane metalloprotease [Albitalea terrae]
MVEYTFLFSAALAAIVLFLLLTYRFLRSVGLVRQIEPLLPQPATAQRFAGLLLGLEALVALYGVHRNLTLPCMPQGLSQALFENLTWSAALAATVATFLFAAVEEVFFRLVLLQVLRRFMPLLPALVLQAAIFSAAHDNASIQAFANRSLAGLLYGAFFVATGSWWKTALLHALSNLPALAISALMSHSPNPVNRLLVPPAEMIPGMMNCYLTVQESDFVFKMTEVTIIGLMALGATAYVLTYAKRKTIPLDARESIE